MTKYIKPQTLKGFRDFLPQNALKRKFLIQKVVEVFEKFGFDPLETPAIEYEEVLLGKYGEEADNLLYRFSDKGNRKVALRYDQTVPTARVVAQYPQLVMPYKRYQIQPVWRAEKPQKGRFREFLHCDADIFGTTSSLSDTEILALSYFVLKNIGFDNFRILINDRRIFDGIPPEAIRILDKLDKIGKDKVFEELKKNNLSTDFFDAIRNSKETEMLLDIKKYINEYGIDKDVLSFSPTLARGLDYYTSMIFEIIIDGYDAGSVCGGGRYDNLIGLFTGKEIPAVGFAFGFDRLLEAAESFNLIPINNTSSKVLVTIFSPELVSKSLKATSTFRKNGINAEIYPDVDVKLDKQLKYADKKSIPYAVIIGPDEAKNNKITIKNLKEKSQQTVSQDEIPAIFKKSS